jgi:hypothetical protein
VGKRNSDELATSIPVCCLKMGGANIKNRAHARLVLSQIVTNGTGSTYEMQRDAIVPVPQTDYDYKSNARLPT